MDPIERDLRIYRRAGLIAAMAFVTVVVVGGMALKADKKQTRIMYGSCYVATDGDMVCIAPSEVAR